MFTSNITVTWRKTNALNGTRAHVYTVNRCTWERNLALRNTLGIDIGVMSCD